MEQPEHSAAEDEGSTPRVVPWLAAVVLLAAAARAVSFCGYAGSDDASYVEIAWFMSRGEFPPTPHGALPQYPTRLGLLAPTALAFRLAGPREWAFLAYPAAVSFGTVLLAYWAGRRLFNAKAGLIAAAVCAVMPLDCRFATWLLTDAPAAFWGVAGVLLVHAGSRRARRADMAGLGLLAGLCFGASWLTRISVVYLAPFVGGFLLLCCFRERRCAWLLGAVALASAAVFVAEGLLYAATQGDFFHRIAAAEKTYYAWTLAPGGGTGWGRGEYGFELAKRLIKTGPCAMFLNWKIGLAPLVGLVGLAHGAWRRDRRFAFAGAWFLVSAFMYNFGSVSVHRYQPLPPIDAYLYPLFFPSALLVGAWADVMLARSRAAARELARERLFWAGLGLCTVAAASAWGIVQNARDGIGSPVERRVRRMVGPGDLLYTDPRTGLCLRFFWGFPESVNTHDFTRRGPREIPAGALVLVNRPRIRRMVDLGVYRPPDFVTDIPGNWQPVWSGAGAELYRVKAAP